MNSKKLLVLILPALILVSSITAKAQSNLNALMNAIETLQFLKDVKENKGKVETIAKEIKTKYRETDADYILLRDKYMVVKLAADNILNNLVIDLMDKDKRKLFKDRPGLITDLYSENVQLYNQSVLAFNAAYQKTKEGKDAGIFNFLKEVAGLLFSELMEAAKKIAIEVLVERLKAPYQMKSWKEV